MKENFTQTERKMLTTDFSLPTGQAGAWLTI
jgi:hypothetical protein